MKISTATGGQGRIRNLWGAVRGAEAIRCPYLLLKILNSFRSELFLTLLCSAPPSAPVAFQRPSKCLPRGVPMAFLEPSRAFLRGFLGSSYGLPARGGRCSTPASTPRAFQRPSKRVPSDFAAPSYRPPKGVPTGVPELFQMSALVLFLASS